MDAEPVNDLDTLATLVEQERDTVLAQWRRQVRQLPSARHLDTPTLNDHMPNVLDQLAEELRAGIDETIAETHAAPSSLAHGVQRAEEGFDIEEVVAEYNILRGCVHDLADAHGVQLQGRPFHIVNRVLDQGIGAAVRTYAALRAREVQQRREEYLAFVAHDLRAPLNAMSLATQFLGITLPALPARPEQLAMLATLSHNIERLDHLVGKVLKENTALLMEMSSRLERSQFALWPLIETLIHDLFPVGGDAGTRIVNEVPGDLHVDADADMVSRIFQNLLANAIAYTPHGKVTVGARSYEGGVECWVSDNGSGIPSARLGKVFDVLETDPLKMSGVGLGLTIVKTFVEAHGGEVAVESTPGRGSFFRFTLPAA